MMEPSAALAVPLSVTFFSSQLQVDNSPTMLTISVSRNNFFVLTRLVTFLWAQISFLEVGLHPNKNGMGNVYGPSKVRAVLQ